MPDEKGKLGDGFVIRIPRKAKVSGKSETTKRRKGPYPTDDDEIRPVGFVTLLLLDGITQQKVVYGHEAIDTNIGAVDKDFHYDQFHTGVSAEDLSSGAVEDMNGEILSYLSGNYDDQPIKTATGEETYRLTPRHYPLSHAHIGNYGLTLTTSRRVELTDDTKWKLDPLKTIPDTTPGTEVFGYIEDEPPIPDAAYIKRPPLNYDLGTWPPLDDPPVEGDFSTAYPVATIYLEDYWKHGRLSVDFRFRGVKLETDSIFYEPFDTKDLDNYKLTLEPSYEADEVLLPTFHPNNQVYIWLMPQNWRFQVDWTGYMLATWSSKDHPIHAFRGQLSTLASIDAIIVSDPSHPGFTRGTIFHIQGSNQDMDGATVLREYTDETRGYYFCTTEPGHSQSDYIYIGGRAAVNWPEIPGYPGTEHDITFQDLDPIPFEYQRNQVGQKALEFSMVGYKKAITKPLFPRQYRKRTEPVDVRRWVGNQIGGHGHDVAHDVSTGFFPGIGLHQGLTLNPPTVGYSPCGNAWHPNADSEVVGFDFDDYSYEDQEITFENVVAGRHSESDLENLILWIETSYAYQAYFGSDAYFDTVFPAVGWNAIVQAVDASVTGHSTVSTARRYYWPSRPFIQGYWVTSDAVFTVEQVNSPEGTLVAVIAKRKPDGTIDEDKRVYVWRKTDSTGRDIKIIDDQPYDSITRSDGTTPIVSAAYGDYDPAGVIDFTL